MHIAITGGTGLIGTELTRLLHNQGHDVTILTRDKHIDTQGATYVNYVTWLHDDTTPENALGTVDAFVNLAGVSINEGRWTKTRKQNIYNSRMQATDEVLRIIQAMPTKPAALINASAVGIYPTSSVNIYTEAAPIQPDDFLGRTVADWEQKARHAEQYGTRVAFTRFGVVLAQNGGALPLMSLPYKLFGGGTIGTGNQWLSWVHVTDAARAIAFAIHNETIRGPVNVTAPNPLPMKRMGKTIANVLRRPHWIPVPSPAMKIALGKKSKLVLEGQYVRPDVLKEAGFTFKYPTLQPALEDLFRKKQT